MRARGAPLLWLTIFSFSAIFFLVNDGGEFRHSTRILETANLGWVAVAMATEVALIALIAMKYQHILRRLGYRIRLLSVFRAHTRRHLVTTVVPFGGPASLYTFSRDLATRGVSFDNAVFTSVISCVASEAAFILFLTPILIGLVVTQQASTAVLVGSSLILLMFVAIAVALTLLLRGTGSPGWLKRRVPQRLTEFLECARAHQLRPRGLIIPAGLAFGVNILGVLTLDAALHAVGSSPSIWTLLVARAVGSVVMLVAPVMQGAGIVEVSMVGILQQSGVPIGAALAAIMLFRLIQFWFPLLLGALAYVDFRAGAIAVRRLRAWGAAAGTVASLVLLFASVKLSGPRMERPLFDEGPNLELLLVILAAFALIAAGVSAAPANRLAFASDRLRRRSERGSNSD